jgi:antitoxin (DNA-binding transcriptional repressor) of toxin-antitoxin stability system
MRIGTHEAKTHLSKYLSKVEAGAAIVICRGDTPIARLVPYRAGALDARARPKVGSVLVDGVKAQPDTWEPLTDTELETEWGL